jgi:hypothetical protein
LRHHRKAMQRLLDRVFGGWRGGNPSTQSAKPTGITKRLAITHRDAALRLTDWQTVKSSAYRNQKIKASHDGSEPEILEFSRHFVSELEKRGYPLFAFELYRSRERQLRLLMNKVTKAQPGDSPHNWGCAVDVVHSTRFWDLTKLEWDLIGAIGKEVARKRKIKVVWGGDWQFYDPAHWELENWRDVRTHRSHDPQEGPCPCPPCEKQRKVREKTARLSPSI